jgi:hypothetical protein
MEKKKSLPQKWVVRFFVARTFDATIESHSLEDALKGAAYMFRKGRGKGFRKGRALIVLKTWADPADEAAIKAYGVAGYNVVGSFAQPVFVVSEHPPEEDWQARPMADHG